MGSSNTAGGGGAGGGGKKFQTLRSNPLLPTLVHHGSGTSSGNGTSANALTIRALTNNTAEGVPVTLPAGVQDGDEVWVHLAMLSNVAAAVTLLTPPTGWEAPSVSSIESGGGAGAGRLYNLRVVARAGVAVAGQTFRFSIGNTDLYEYAYVISVVRPPAGVTAPLTFNAFQAVNGNLNNSGGAVTSNTGLTTDNTTLHRIGAPATVVIPNYRTILFHSTLTGSYLSGGGTTSNNTTGRWSVPPTRTGASAVDKISDALVPTTGVAQPTVYAGNPNHQINLHVTAHYHDAGQQVVAPNAQVTQAINVTNVNAVTMSQPSWVAAPDNRISLLPFTYQKSAFQQIFASTSFPSTDLLIELTPRSVLATSATTTVLLDIATGAAGAEQIVVADVSASDVALANAQPNGPIRLSIPLRIPAGQRLSVRGYVESTANTPAYTVNATLVG